MVTVEPPRAVVLGIDPGAIDGACLLIARTGNPTVHIVHGGALGHHGRAGMVSSALAVAECEDLPLIVGVERWTAGGMKGIGVWIGMGKARGRWDEQLDIVGVEPWRVVQAAPQTWKAKVLGIAPNTSSEGAKAASLLYVQRRFGVTTTGDGAAATCIALWALSSDDGRKVLARDARERKRGARLAAVFEKEAGR